MVDPPALAVTIPLLVLALAVALRGRDMLTAASVAVLGGAFAVLIGAIGGGPAADEVYDIAPTVVFLSILLVLGHLADAEGLFDWAAAVLARRAGHAPVATFRRVFVLAAVTTAILSLDATVVLLTPVIVATIVRRRLAARPQIYACGHLANSASLLMPVSNLTNLLAFSATGLSFLSFTALMALPWLVAVAVEYAVLRRIFAADLTGQAAQVLTEPHPTPWWALAVVALTVAGFAVGSPIGLAPVWPAAAGAMVLALRRLVRRTSSVNDIIESANLPFALFIFGLAVLVRGVAESGLSDLLSAILPTGDSLGALLAVAGVAAVLANLVNNLPATLALLPVATLIGTPAILAVLIGVNVGANLTYVGSLANLLWRRVLAPSGDAPSATSFTAIGLLTVPLTLIAATVALWISVRIWG
ncbi:MAG: arsenic transporter [Geodermatophilaceae bacterium]|nr:arsenic transporter [Geodermatophilaceae bacterium]